MGGNSPPPIDRVPPRPADVASPSNLAIADPTRPIRYRQIACRRARRALLPATPEARGLSTRIRGPQPRARLALHPGPSSGSGREFSLWGRGRGSVERHRFHSSWEDQHPGQSNLVAVLAPVELLPVHQKPCALPASPVTPRKSRRSSAASLRSHPPPEHVPKTLTNLHLLRIQYRNHRNSSSEPSRARVLSTTTMPHALSAVVAPAQ